MNLIQFYEQRRASFLKSLSETKQKINRVSTIRLIIAGAFLILFYLALAEKLIFYFLPIITIFFIVLVRKHSELFDLKIHLENLVKINENEIQSLKGDLSCFANGANFQNPHHPYAYDLDIFGDDSLYQSVNRSSTLNGKIKLAAALTQPLTSSDQIVEQQENTKELSIKVDFRQHFLATGMELEELPGDKQQLLNWVKQKPFLYGRTFLVICLWLLPVIMLSLFILMFFIDGLTPFILACAGLQWTLLSTQLKKVNLFHQYVNQKKNILNKYARLLHLFGKENFQTSILKHLQAKATSADRKINTLANLVSALDARLNFLTNLFVNSFLMYDLNCIYRLEKWKEENADNLEIWIDTITDTDVISSLATFYFNNPDFTFPSITSEKNIKVIALGHPLISAHERITNSMSMNDRSMMIITGANMAGKSTFLRTLGVNLVLALNGAPVCAESFSCPIISLRTGMRTADSLKDHQSYFYAELDRLKTIMDELRSGKPLLILLDEILKGTNSTDKQAGSIALVKQLIGYDCMGIIATHDLALGELEKDFPDQIKNYCFEPTIENDQLSFDYKLKSGLAQKMNATFLMKKMGIIPK